MDERTEVTTEATEVPEVVETETIHPNRRLWRDVLSGTGSGPDGSPRPRYADDQLKTLGRVILETSKEEDQSKWPEWMRSYVNGGVPLMELLADLISEVENRSQRAAEIALETEIASETEFPIAKLLSPEEAKQVLESGRQITPVGTETIPPEDVAELLKTPQEVTYLNRGDIANVYSFSNIPGWVVKIPLEWDTPETNLRFPQEEKLLAQIAAQERETGRPRTCPNIVSGYASGEKPITYIKTKGNTANHANKAIVMEAVEEYGQRYWALQSSQKATDEANRGIMQTAIRQILLHGQTLVELGAHERDRTANDYFWDNLERHIVVLDYNVMSRPKDALRINQNQVHVSGRTITKLASGGRSIYPIDRDSIETVNKSWQEIEGQILTLNPIDKPTMEFLLRCFYNDIIPGHQTMDEAIRAYDRILSANVVPNDRRDLEIESALQRGDTKDAYNIAYYSTDDRRQERLSSVLKVAGGKSPYQLAKEAVLAHISSFREARKSVDEKENELDDVNAGTVSKDMLDQLRRGMWDKVTEDPKFTEFRGTPLEEAIYLMKITWSDQGYHDLLAENLFGDKENLIRMLITSLKLLKNISLADGDKELLRLVKSKLTEDMNNNPGNEILRAKLKIVARMLSKKPKNKKIPLDF